jgi:hypothetical protein
MILDDGVTPIVFTDELVWQDEFSWSPVQQSQQYSIGGTLVVQEAKKLSGRPITLKGSDKVWETRDIVQALHNASLVPFQQFTLTLHDNSTKTVMFDKQNTPLETEALFSGQDVESTDQYIINTLRFIEV